jgi:hypothetical protein
VNYWKYKPYAVKAWQLLYEHKKAEIATFDGFCRTKGVNSFDKITTKVCDQYMDTVQTKNGKRGANFGAHRQEINALAKYSVNDLKSGEDLDADPFAQTTDSLVKETGIDPTIRRRNSFSKENFEISTEARSFIRTWVRVHRKDKKVT